MDLRPSNSEEIGGVIESRLEARVSGSSANQDSISVDWRDARLSIPVIQMPIELVYYNPHTRRIRAQRDIDEARERELLENPFGSSAQNYLEDLLQWDPARPGHVDPSFEALRDDIKEHGQNEAGIITRDGVLINGNTRRVALKKLGRTGIFVGVLPTDTSRTDIDGLELALQLRRTHKRDYSFVNELLAIDEKVRAGIPTQEILKAFRMKQERFKRSRWLLQFIDDAIERSRVEVAPGKNVALRRYDFERDQGQLEELYRSWMKLERDDPDKAAVLRDSRLVGVVLNFAKTDLRVIREDFVDKYLKQRLPEGLLPESAEAEVLHVPGLPDVELAAPSSDSMRVREFTDKVLRYAALRNNSSPSAPLDEGVAETLGVIQSAFERAKRDAGADEEYRKKGLTPADRVQAASDQLEFAITALAEARSVGTLDVASMEDALETLRKSLTKLAQLAGRIEQAEDMDIGFAWLEEIANLGSQSE